MFHHGKYTLINESVVLVRHYRFLTVYNVSCAGTAVVKAPERPDVLDAALFRPGRFDRQVTIDGSDVHGRLNVLGCTSAARWCPLVALSHRRTC